MPKPKVCVYSICKNEEKFIDRFMQSIHEADCIVVLDTGSTDNSLNKLHTYPIIVSEALITPWRFDEARNMALALVPEDITICISMDMDEVLLPGWYDKLTAAWQPTTTAAQCRFVWHFTEDGREDGVFWPIRIHSRHDYTWQHTIHEVLTYTGNTTANIITIDGIQFNHYPDPDKKRDYLPMLKNAVAADPSNARDVFYLGREYSYYGNWEKCFETLSHYLTLSNWKDERCCALRLMGKASLNLNQVDAAISLLMKSHEECPYMREPLIDLAIIYYDKKDWKKVLYYVDIALQITSPSRFFINEGYAWGNVPHDLYAIASFYLGHYDKALAHALKCLDYTPDDTRLLSNVNFYRDYILTH